MIGEDVLFSGIREIGAHLRARRLSAVDLTEMSLRRLETLGPKLGAVVTVTRARALAQAHRANQELLAGKDRGPLHGIPYGAKDLLATKGIPTTWGAEPLPRTRSSTTTRPSSSASRRRARCSSPSWRWSSSPEASATTTPTRASPARGARPGTPTTGAAARRAGPAAAVAAGLVAFAIGSETSGSILTPAAFCGVTGLRPTYGLVSRHGAMALCWTLDKLGPLARSADDCGLVLSAIAGHDPYDPTTGESFRYREKPAKRGRPGQRFRVGVLRHATAGAAPDVETRFKEALSVLRDVADLEEDVSFPDLPYRDAVGIIVDAEGASAFRDLIESGKVKRLRDAADRVGGYAMMMTRAADYIDAMRSRVAMRAELDLLLSRYDALVAPTRGGARSADRARPRTRPRRARRPRRRTRLARRPRSRPGTWPAFRRSPCRWASAADRLPTSLQLLGRAFSEETLLALATAYQEMTDWHRQRPPGV